MFKSIYSFELNQYYTLRSSTLSMSALQHEECYLRRFDDYLSETVREKGMLNEDCCKRSSKIHSFSPQSAHFFSYSVLPVID